MGKVTHGKWAKYTRMYKLEWEEDPHLRGWVAPVEGMRSKAWCLICRTKLRAHKTDLLKHAASQKHKENMSVYGLDELPGLHDEGSDLVPSEMVVQVVREPTNDTPSQNPPPTHLYATVESPVSLENGSSQSSQTNGAEPCILTVLPQEKTSSATQNVQGEQRGRPTLTQRTFLNTRRYDASNYRAIFLGRNENSQKRGSDPTTSLLIVEKERLAVERARLALEKERLKVEKERLAFEQERLLLKREEMVNRQYTTYVVEAPTPSSMEQDEASKSM